VGDEKAGGRRRAVGTRDRVMSHLLMVGEVRDASGMASTALAEAIAYPGSSIAFAQLLSGMERSGLIEREIRGKRTYRISPAASASAPARTGAAPQRRARPVAGQGGARAAAAEGGPGTTEDFDYDELARRLLLQVVQRLSTLPVEGAEPAEDAGPVGVTADSDVSLARAVAGLEQKLASVRSNQQRLTEENAKLREQLRAAQESLAQAQERAAADPAAVRLDSAEIRLLERLLSPLRDKGSRQEEAGAG
jgi:hypothetical protein